MKKIRVLRSPITNPWFNLAIEDWIFHHLDPQTHILYLWRNERTVVIGQNQNPWVECRLDKMQRDNITLARRQSGGGAVFHDLGNTNFTFLSTKQNYQQNANFSIIIGALQKHGIHATASGRNDLLVEGRKISGSAFKHTTKRCFHHGTLLIDADLSQLANYLNPHPLKLEAKGIKSVKSRVANLKEFNRDIDHDSLSHSIIESFCSYHNAQAEVEELQMDDLKGIEPLHNFYQKMSDPDWRFGKTPEFSHTLETRFSWGIIDIRLNIKKGVIDECVIFSDALDVEFIQHLQETLQQCRYAQHEITSALSKLAIDRPEFGSHIDELVQWFKDESLFA